VIAKKAISNAEFVMERKRPTKSRSYIRNQTHDTTVKMATIGASGVTPKHDRAHSDSNAAAHMLWNTVQQQTQLSTIETDNYLCTLYSGKAIHANEIDVLRTSNINTTEQTATVQRYIAGQSQASLQLSADFIIKGIESGQGVFQFVSRAAHYGGQSRETPLIDQLIAAIKEQKTQGKALSLDDTYTVVSLNEETSFRELTDDSNRSYCKSFLLTVKDGLGQQHTIPLTQVGLQFTNALMRADDIELANRALTKHKEQLPQKNTLAASHQTPMVLSYAGVGRNSSLITYHEMTQWILGNPTCSESDIDEHLKYLVTQGRMARGPRFVHSEQQFAELRRAVIKFQHIKNDRVNHTIPAGAEPTDSVQANTLKVLRKAPHTLPNKLVRSIDYQNQSIGPIKWGLQHQQQDILFQQNAHSTNPANRIKEHAPKALPLAQQQSKSKKPHPYHAEKPHAHLSALTVERTTHNKNNEELAIESMMMQLLGQNDAEKDALAGELYTQLLRKSLNVACGKNAQKILSTLVTLQGIRPLDEIAKAKISSADNTFTAPNHPNNLAWKVLAELGTVPLGMDVIRKITKGMLNAQQEGHFEILMKATHHLNIQDAITPASLLCATRGLNDVAAHAVPALFSKLTNGPEEPDPNDWAINAIKNELFNTEPGSDFSIIANRLSKFGEWVKRAEQDRRFSIRFPFKNKSPFRGLQFGLQSVDRGDINAHKKTWKTAIDQATELLTKQIDSHIRYLNKRISAEENASDELDDNSPLLHAHVLRKQISDFLQIRNAITEHPPNIKLLKHAKADFLSLCAASDANYDKKMSRLLKSAEKRKVRDKRKFANPDVETKFNHLLETASHAQYGKTTALNGIKKESLEESLHYAIDHMQGASRLKLYNGGIGGVGTKGITGSISNLAGVFLVRARLDLRASKMRQAVFELAMPPYNLEMIIGSQTTHGYQVGGGVAVGPDASVVALTAGFDAVAYSRDVGNTNGICVRLPRNRGKEQQLRKDYKQLVSDLIGLTTEKNTSEKKSPEQILKILLAKYPELTVNVIDQFNDARTKHSVTAETTLTVGEIFAKGVLAAGPSGEYHSSIGRHYSDKTGHMKVQRTLGGKLLKGILSVRASLRPIINSGEVTVGAGTTDVYNLSAEIATAGQTIRRELVASHGRYNPVSFVEIEHQTLEHFKQSIVDNISEWVRAKAIQLKKTQEQAHADIMRFIDQAASHHTITQTFAERYELKPDAAKLAELLESNATLARHADPHDVSGESARLQAQADAILQDFSSYEPTSFRIYERSDTQQKDGIQMIGQLQGVTSAEGVYAHSRLM
jgi:hypothetical protein